MRSIGAYRGLRRPGRLLDPVQCRGVLPCLNQTQGPAPFHSMKRPLAGWSRNGRSYCYSWSLLPLALRSIGWTPDFTPDRSTLVPTGARLASMSGRSRSNGSTVRHGSPFGAALFLCCSVCLCGSVLHCRPAIVR